MSLERKTAMKRTPFKSEPKPASGKPRAKACKACRQKFEPRSPLAVVCSVACSIVHGKTVTKQQKAKQQRQERAQDKIKREAMKTYPQLIRECQKAFNAVVRYRDMMAGYPCISSGRPLDWNGNAVDAGHYRSTGSAPHLRFNFDNCHAQSKHDNLWKSGNAVDYRINLIARIGLARVEALESDNTPANWSHDDLRQMMGEFRSMLREMKKGNNDA